MPRLPRKTKVNVRLCHACHMKRRWMSPSATPATQSAAASRATKPGPRAPPSAMSATPATQNQGGCEIAPRLPRETKVDVTKCHTPATQSAAASRATKPGQRAPPGAMSATPAAQNQVACEIVPRLPRETKVDVTKCHTPATQSAAASRATKQGPRAPPSAMSAMSATPATQNQGGCEIVPRLPRETKVDVTKRHACHAK